MKGTEFINLMRKVIREEVRAVVKEELKSFKPVIVESKQQSVTKLEAPKRKVVQPEPLIKRQEPVFKGPLADILQETYAAMKNEPPVDDPEAAWPDMNGGVVTMDNMPGGMGMSMAAMMDDDFGSRLNNQPTQQTTTQPLMRDYSAILRKADDIANNKR
jgi:hypothetical protein